MNKIQYIFHLLLQHKSLTVFYIGFALLLSYSFNSTTVFCETDNNNSVKDEIVKNNNPKVLTALILFIMSIFFKFLILPYIIDGTLIERITEIIKDKPYEEVYEPATTQEVLDWGEDWLRKELGLDHLSEEELRALLFGKKK